MPGIKIMVNRISLLKNVIDNAFPQYNKKYINISIAYIAKTFIKTEPVKKRIAILGAGPSGLFMYKRLVECGRQDFAIEIFELSDHVGAGMPYSEVGANIEHVTNVSGNEIPSLITSLADWIKIVPKEKLDIYKIDAEKFNNYKVLPRLLFGEYLSAQFDLLKETAVKAGIETIIHLNSGVTDVIDQPYKNEAWIEIAGKEIFKFDSVIICIGHRWPGDYEGRIPGYFDSPYPPAKLCIRLNHPVAVRGSSLTAIDAIRTLARANGTFAKDKDDKHSFILNEDSNKFRIIMHSRNGLLPAIRFHLEDSHLSKNALLSHGELLKHREENDGFISLDFVFEKNFTDSFRKKDPEFFDHIRDMNMEDFVAYMMNMRESIEPFLLFKGEYAEAEKSIRRRQSVYWKEMLAILSFAMNYPAKYLCAEDMLRLQKVLMPLISIVIAFVPQSSCEELIALYDSQILDLIPVGADSKVEPVEDGGIIYHFTDDSNKSYAVEYKTFVECVGQPHLSYRQFPFKSLLLSETVSPAQLKFKSAAFAQSELERGNEEVERGLNGDYFLNVPGITINDDFQLVDKYGAYNERIYMMAVPYIGGYNPDYSGLDFCEEASGRIIKNMLVKG